MKVPFLIARVIFGGFFLCNGIHHFRHHRQMMDYAASKNVPQADLAVTASGAALVLGGASILLGLKPKIGTALIAGFLAGVSPVMHDFWRAEDPNQRMNDTIHFSKNAALLGGALALMSIEEPWPASVQAEKPGAATKLRRVGRAIAA